VFNATFNNISLILWRSVILMGETGKLGKTTDMPQVTNKPFSHNVVSSTPRHERDSNKNVDIKFSAYDTFLE
jgi:hypothetical protein